MYAAGSSIGNRPEALDVSESRTKPVVGLLFPRAGEGTSQFRPWALAGFGLNDELTNEFRTSGAGGRQGAGVIRAALDYLQLFVPTNLTELVQVLHAVRRNIPWLEGPLALAPNDRVLMMTTGKDADLWTRLRPLIPKKRVTVFTCGPFFDRKLSFLKRLVSDVKPQRLVVGIDPESVVID